MTADKMKYCVSSFEAGKLVSGVKPALNKVQGQTLLASFVAKGMQHC